MKRLKWFLIFLILTYCHYTYLQSLTVTKITDVFATFSGRNAIVLHFSIYVCIMCLLNIEYFYSVKSEWIIRIHRLNFVKNYIKKSIINSFSFLLIFYFSGSLFVIYYLGLEHYISMATYIPCVLSMIIYIIIYVIFSLLLMLMFIYIKKTILGVTITTILGILLFIVLRQPLGYLSFFEMFYDGDAVIFPFIQALVITLLILIVLTNILMEVFQRKDLIYEEKL